MFLDPKQQSVKKRKKINDIEGGRIFTWQTKCFLVQVYLIEGFQTYSLPRHIGKREADAEALHGTVATTLYNTRISKPIKKVPVIVILIVIVIVNLIVVVIVIVLEMFQSPSTSISKKANFVYSSVNFKSELFFMSQITRKGLAIVP